MKRPKVNEFTPNFCSHARQNSVADEWICLDCGAYIDPLNPDRAIENGDDPWTERWNES